MGPFTRSVSDAAAKPAPVVAALALGLILNQLAIMAVPAVIVDLTGAWSLDADEIGWLGGIYFAGYAAGLPLVSGVADRIGGRMAYAGSVVLAAGSAFAFAALADGLWLALVLRFLAGAGFSGAHIVGMKLLADRLSGETQARAGAFYSAAYALGSGVSFLVAGPLGSAVGWEAVFLAAGLGALASLPCLIVIGPDPAEARAPARGWLPDFVGALRDPDVRRYVFAYAGNTWEVFAIRVWFVPLLSYNAALHGGGTGWSPAVLAGISAIVAVPVSLLVAETGIRLGRERTIIAVCAVSAAVCLVLGLGAGGPYWLVLALLFVHGATSYGDAGAINGGVIQASRPENRSAALALFGLSGFVSGFLGSLAVGLAIQLGGGTGEPTAWLWGFAAMALGPVAAAVAMSAGGRGSRLR